MGRISVSTIIKLVVASLLVGIVLTMIGADPVDFWVGIWHALQDAVDHVWTLGWDGLLQGARFVLVGAAVVIPIWVISLVLKSRNGPKPPSGTAR